MVNWIVQIPGWNDILEQSVVRPGVKLLFMVIRMAIGTAIVFKIPRIACFMTGGTCYHICAFPSRG